MEQTIRDAVGQMKSGDSFTAEWLAHRLDLDESQVCIWLDLLADEGKLIPEHRVVSEFHGSKSVVHYRVPQHF
jgi:hypothetical protein